MSDSDDQGGFGKPFGESPPAAGTPFGEAPGLGASDEGGPTGFGTGPAPGGFGDPSDPATAGGGPGGPPPGGGGGPMGHIPFDAGESATIRSLATLLMMAGAIGIVSAVIAGVNGITTSLMANRENASELVGNLTGNLVAIVITLSINGILAYWMVKGARSFRKMVDTDGADQALLIDALAQLRNIFWMKAILFLVGFFCLACVMITLLFATASLLGDVRH